MEKKFKKIIDKLNLFNKTNNLCINFIRKSIEK